MMSFNGHCNYYFLPSCERYVASFCPSAFEKKMYIYAQRLPFKLEFLKTVHGCLGTFAYRYVSLIQQFLRKHNDK